MDLWRLSAGDMPQFRDPGGEVWVWDPATKTYSKRPEKEIPDRSHASGGDNELFDPVTQTERAQNPLQLGFMGSWGSFEGDLDLSGEGEVKCPNCGEVTDMPQCPTCGKGLAPEWNREEGARDLDEMAYQQTDHPDGMPVREPKRNRMKTDDSYPSMISKVAGEDELKRDFVPILTTLGGGNVGKGFNVLVDKLNEAQETMYFPDDLLTLIKEYYPGGDPIRFFRDFQRLNEAAAQAYDLEQQFRASKTAGWGFDEPARTEVGKWIEDITGQMHVAQDPSLFHEQVAEQAGLRWPSELGALGSVYDDGTADVQKVFNNYRLDQAHTQATLQGIFGQVELAGPAGEAQAKEGIFSPFTISGGTWVWRGVTRPSVSATAWVKERSNGVQFDPVNMILVAEHLQPEDAFLYESGPPCMVTATGGGSSHAAIVAGTRGWPAVCGIGPDAYSKIETGNYLKVDYAGQTSPPKTITVMPLSREDPAGMQRAIEMHQLQQERANPSLRPRPKYAPAFSHVDEETTWNLMHAASLDECPECRGPMAERGDTKFCPDCGHKQPIITASTVREATPALLAPLGLGLARGLGMGALMGGGEAAAGGAAAGAMGGGGMAGIGGLMTRALGQGAIMGGAQNLMNGGPQVMDPMMQGPVAPGAGMAGQYSHAIDSHFMYAAFGEEEVGRATKNRGEDSDPESASSTGIMGEEEQGDSPEQLKDVGGGGPEDSSQGVDSGTMELSEQQQNAIRAFEVNLPLIQEFADDPERSGADHPIIKAIDAMLEDAFPGYKELADAMEGMDDPEVEALEEVSGQDLDGDSEDGEAPEHKEKVEARRKVAAGGQMGQMGLVVGPQGNIIGQFVSDNGDGTIKILTAQGYQDVPAQSVRIEKAAGASTWDWSDPSSPDRILGPNGEGARIEPNPGLEYMTPDTLAETVNGISMPTYQRLWDITLALDEQGKGAPVGGDRHDPEGEFGPPMVEDPYSQRDIIMSGQGNVISIWDQLSPEQQREINAAMEASDAEWDAGMERARAEREQSNPAVQAELARHDRLGNTFTAPDVPPAGGQPTCPICGQNHQPGTPCPADPMMQPQAQPAMGMQPMMMPQPGVQPKVVTKVADTDDYLSPDEYRAQNSRAEAINGPDPTQDWYFAEDPWGQNEDDAVVCPECEQAEMIFDDHVYVCPSCGYETSEPTDEEHIAEEHPGVAEAIRIDNHSKGYADVLRDKGKRNRFFGKFADTAGEPLKVGADYELRAPNYAVPDYVVVDRVLPDKVVFTIKSGDMRYRDELSEKQIRTHGYEFAPGVEGPTSADHGPMDPDPVRPGHDPIPQVTDLSDQPTKVSADIPYNPGAPAGVQTRQCLDCGGQMHEERPGQFVCVNCGVQDDGNRGPYNDVRPEWARQPRRPSYQDTLQEQAGAGLPRGQYHPPGDPRRTQGGYELTPQEQQDVEETRAKYGDKAAQALEGSIRGTQAFNETDGGEFTADAWAAGVNQVFNGPHRQGSEVQEMMDRAAADEGIKAVAAFAGDQPDSRNWLMEDAGGGVDVDPALMAKLAGKDFSPREQREFIDETGEARNLSKLDLEGTHYVVEDDLDVAFNW